MNPVKRVKIETSIEYFSLITKDHLKFILSCLSMNDLRRVELVCKNWKAQALDCWKKVAIEEIGPVAATLFQNGGVGEKSPCFVFKNSQAIQIC